MASHRDQPSGTGGTHAHSSSGGFRFPGTAGGFDGSGSGSVAPPSFAYRRGSGFVEGPDASNAILGSGASFAGSRIAGLLMTNLSLGFAAAAGCGAGARVASGAAGGGFLSGAFRSAGATRIIAAITRAVCASADAAACFFSSPSRRSKIPGAKPIAGLFAACSFSEPSSGAPRSAPSSSFSRGPPSVSATSSACASSSSSSSSLPSGSTGTRCSANCRTTAVTTRWNASCIAPLASSVSNMSRSSSATPAIAAAAMDSSEPAMPLNPRSGGTSVTIAVAASASASTALAPSRFAAAAGVASAATFAARARSAAVTCLSTSTNPGRLEPRRKPGRHPPSDAAMPTPSCSRRARARALRGI
mmetsp:Transcript_12472/g.52270  ORF Transcript_12472/g.52270 Transcript_12472/m.52270 type:complete len:360 (-) Transcript_12472:1774-2853(-)